jgi:hypothetical protein
MKAVRRAFLLAAFAASVLPAASPESEDFLAPSPFASPSLSTDAGADRAAAARRDSLRADSLLQAAIDSASRAAAGRARRKGFLAGPPALPHPVLAAAGVRGPGTAPRPPLAILPTAAGRGGRVTPEEREAAEAALRLGAEQLGRFRVLSAEETARPWGRLSAVPRHCFTAACARRAAARLETRLLLLSELSRPRVPGASGASAAPPPRVAALALIDPSTGKVLRSLQARACPDADPVPFLQESVWRLFGGLLLPDESAAADRDSASRGDAAAARTAVGPSSPDDSPAVVPPRDSSGSGDRPEAAAEAAASARAVVPADAAEAPAPGTAPPAAPAALGGCDRIEELRVGSGDWRGIPWLNPADSVDNRRRWGAAGGGLLIAGLGLAWAQGQLLQEDGNGSSPAGTVLRDGGAPSWMRGFFAVPNLGARYAALGGAGIAHASNALALILNPAGVADAARENVLAAKRSLPDGSPSLFLAYAGPLREGWFQGLGIQHEGDGLANETTLHGALAGDWGSISRSLAGIKTGASLKIYLAKVGEEGTGLDRSTGHSFGMGLDLGFRMSLSDRIAAALSVRDALGFLRHVNTFTDESRAEILPPEYRIGAAYRATPSTLMLLDGQKALVADQVDHVRLGVERVAFGFLALRGGLHQAFGREAVRKLALGFGLDTDGLGDRPLPGRLAVHYAYEFGLDEDQPLGGGQQFSLEFDW